MRTRFVVDTFNIGSLHPVSALNGNAALVDSSGEPWNPDDIDYDQIALLYLLMMMEPIFHDAQQLFLKERGAFGTSETETMHPGPRGADKNLSTPRTGPRLLYIMDAAQPRYKHPSTPRMPETMPDTYAGSVAVRWGCCWLGFDVPCPCPLVLPRKSEVTTVLENHIGKNFSIH